MLSTVKKLLNLPKTRVFLDLQVHFRHRDVLTTEVMSKMILVKGPQDAKYPIKRERRQAVKAEKKVQKKKRKLASLKADKRIIQGAEIYPVYNWVPRNQLNEEEPAIYEVGVRDDATSKDTISWEIIKSQVPDNKEMTFLEKIKAVEGGYELRNSPSCEDLPKEDKKEPSKQKLVSIEKKAKKEKPEEMEKQTELVQPVGKKKVEEPPKEEKIEPQLKSKRILHPEPLVKEEKEEEPQPIIEKKIEEEPLPELSRLKSPEVLDKKEQNVEEKKESASGWMEILPGPKDKTQVTMTVRASK